MALPLEDEIKRCVWEMHPLKSPGPDGFSGVFFRMYWSIIKNQIIQFVQECFVKKRMAPGMNKTFIMLISKSKHASKFNHFRPISLCNFATKWSYEFLRTD